MSTIQSLKNFIRHGKQARLVSPHAEATTNVSTVHAEKQPQGAFSPAAGNLDAIDSKMGTGQQSQSAQRDSADTAGKRNREIEQIIADEKTNRTKMPSYPGLERYVLLEKMGDGAFSNVYRAKDTTGEFDQVAIKVVRKFELNSTQSVAHLHPDFKKKPKAAERANILKEVQIMRQIDHPNIVKLVQFSESRQYYYIVLELCPGGELFHQIVRLTYFSEDLSRHVILQVAKAIEYLHETSGVVHRYAIPNAAWKQADLVSDIKPENLLFYPTEFVPSKNPKPRQPGDEDKVDEGEFLPGKGAGGIGTIKIADFGLSKVIWDSQTMTPCGTVGYTAPEIVKDERYSKSVDMWALGCVLYTLLCGFPPFYDESIQVLTEKVARGQYTFLSPWWDDISKSAKDLISHLLTVNPDERYTIKQFLDHPWIRESNEETYAAADAPPLSTPSATHEMRNQPLDAPAADLAPFPPASAQLSAGDRPMDFRSPGAINLREVFDVGYAVHRQEEEGKRRKAGRGFRQSNPSAAFQSALNPLNEDYDDEDGIRYQTIPDDEHPPAKMQKSTQPGDVAAVEAQMQRTNLGAGATSHAARMRQSHQPRQQQGGYGTHSANVAAAVKQNQVRNARAPFELTLNNATLLEKRGRRHQEQPAA
ncbi:kinase-like domain-containing protein [Aspergillus unguis]